MSVYPWSMGLRRFPPAREPPDGAVRRIVLADIFFSFSVSPAFLSLLLAFLFYQINGRSVCRSIGSGNATGDLSLMIKDRRTHGSRAGAAFFAFWLSYPAALWRCGFWAPGLQGWLHEIRAFFLFSTFASVDPVILGSIEIVHQTNGSPRSAKANGPMCINRPEKAMARYDRA